MMGELPESVVEEIKEYLKTQLVDGFVCDEIKSTVATMYWDKTE